MMTDIDPLLSQMLKEYPTASTRFLADAVDADIETVKHHLIVSLHYKKVSVCWIPHALSPANIVKRKEEAATLRAIFGQMKASKYQYLISGDES
jgi:hypothetical protein